MQITDVRIKKLDRDGNLKAFASVTFDGQLVVDSIAVIKGPEGLFIGMPSRKVGDEYKDICFPLSKEFRQEISDAVISKYEGER